MKTLVKRIIRKTLKTLVCTGRIIMPLETVQRKCCNQCLFSKNKIVSDKRKSQLLDDCKKNNTHFICHKATVKGKVATCSAFYKQKTNSALSSLLESVGEIEFVDID